MNFRENARFRDLGGRVPAIHFRVLGCYGGKEPGCLLPSFLINGFLLAEAGSAASALTLSEQASLGGIVITHAHLDHVAELPYLADNIFGLREESLPIFGLEIVLDTIHKNIFNDDIWPDFTDLSWKNEPILKFVKIREGDEHRVGDVRFTAYQVNHKVPSAGFLFRDELGSILYTGDTGPTEKIWEKCGKIQDLKAIVTEVSFPNSLQNLADVACHFTPATLQKELKKMPSGVPVYLFHEKNRYHEELLRDMDALKEPRLNMLVQGKTYEF